MPSKPNPSKLNTLPWPWAIIPVSAVRDGAEQVGRDYVTDFGRGQIDHLAAWSRGAGVVDLDIDDAKAGHGMMP